jgi:hypothetical protein
VQDWNYEYVGPKRRRKVTPQMRALRERRKNGLKMARPEDTRMRVKFIIAMMRGGQWLGRRSIEALANEWHLSTSRVEQLAAEAKRNG